ncbi:MAG: phospholipid carrier-dependent glycosyltransferase [Gammaproteobacteria bacterium]|nr:phospholipid carrier-dependent glycosyltransferase [Gammaproteobacteria bacterium]
MKTNHPSKHERNIFIFISLLMLFFMLGQRGVWSQETRWTAIVGHMMASHDYLHPFLDGNNYYDKPLLSYWLIVIAAHISGGLNSIAIRLPSALAGAATLWSTYQLGKILFNRRTAMLAAWLLLSTYYFLFWSRTASANMLNLAGIMLALACYFRYRETPSWRTYCLFFLILSLTALCKGLLAPVVVALALLPDLISQQRWRKQCYNKLFTAAIPGLIVYLLPFLLSTLLATQGNTTYHENGLFQVFHENFVRYVHPFDNTNPAYTYFVYLPIYTLPWAPLLLLALIQLPLRWANLSPNSRWLYLALLLIFIFLSLSGSRRSYYVLPLTPLAILIIAEWLQWQQTLKPRIMLWFKRTLIAAITLCGVIFFIVYPLAAIDGGPPLLARKIITQAEKTQSWRQWHIVMLSNNDHVLLYLQSPNLVKYGTLAKSDELTATVSNLGNNPSHTIIILSKRQLAQLEEMPHGYTLIKAKENLGNRLLDKHSAGANVALLPNSAG